LIHHFLGWIGTVATGRKYARYLFQLERNSIYPLYMMLSVSNKSALRSWHVIWGNSHLTLRIQSGSCVGEDEFGELRFGVPPEGCCIEFTIDDQDNLWISTVGNSYQIDMGAGETVVRVRVEPGAQIALPNNLLYISSSIRRTTSSGVLVKLTAAPPSNFEMVANADYGQDPLFDRQPRLNELIETPELNPELSGGFGDERSAANEPVQETAFAQVERKPPYKWFLLGPLIVVAIFVATPTSIEMEPNLTTSSFGLAPAAPAPGSQVPGTRQHVDLLNTLDQVLVNADPDDHSVMDFAADAFKAVLLSDPLNARAQEGLANIQEQRDVTAEGDLAPLPSAGQLAGTVEDKVEITEPSSKVLRSASSTSARTTLLRAEELLYDGDIIAPRGNNAVALIRRILEQDPESTYAKRLLAQCADRLVTMAKRARANAMNYEARNLLEEVLAFYPDHRVARKLWIEWVGS